MTMGRGPVLIVALLVATLPTEFVLAAGRGGGGGGVAGSASGVGQSIGGGAPAGSVGGGPPAGAVGGGAINSGVIVSPGYSTGISGGTSGGTSIGGGVLGGYGGVPASGPLPDAGGRIPPPVPGQGQPPGQSGAPQSGEFTLPGEATPPQDVRGIAETPPPATVGLATAGPDGISTRIVPARPCGVAAHETDGTTTCIGIPSRR
jgi:hypothetical protein